MSEERFDRMEGMISQLIIMVGNMQKSMNEMQNVQKEHGRKFEGIEAKFEGIEAKFEGIDAKFEGIDAKFEGIESKLDALESRMDKMESKNEARHIEVIQQIKRLEKDQDFIWEKAARNERELEIIKRSSES